MVLEVLEAAEQPVEQPQIDPLQAERDRAVFDLLHSSSEGFGQVYKSLVDQTFGFFINNTGNVDTALELNSYLWYRVFANVVKGGVNYCGKPFKSYLFTAADNLCKNGSRPSRRPGIPLESLTDDTKFLIDEGSNVEANLANKKSREEEITSINDGALSLLPQQRLALHLHYVEGLTDTEIGVKMGRSQGAVKSLIHRASRRLRESPPVQAYKARNQEND